jgi:hypothetical protein
LANKTNSYALFVKGGLSYIRADSIRNTGYFYNATFLNLSGPFRFAINRTVYDNRYDPTDMGYLEVNNKVVNGIALQYNDFVPKGILRKYTANLSFINTNLYLPNRYMNFEIDYTFNTMLKDYSSINLYGGTNPFDKYDYYEPRVAGWKFKQAPSFYFGGAYSSNVQRNFTWSVEANYTHADAYQQHTIYSSLGLGYRIGDKFSINYNLAFQNQFNATGFVNYNNTLDSIYFGKRDEKVIRNTVETNYIFSKNSSLSLRLRHYLATVAYSKYYLLKENGEMNENIDFPYSYDQTYNAFNLDFIYTWQFLPGSEVSIAWKNAILNDKSWADQDYFDNLGSTIRDKQINNFSIKLLYYLDYLSLKKSK